MKKWISGVAAAIAGVIMGGIGLALLGAAILVVHEAVTAGTREPIDPNFLEQIIASKTVLAAIRIALIFAAAYVVISVVVLMSRRQWINKIGWVEVSEGTISANEELAAENESLYDALTDLSAENDELRKRLDEADTMIGMLAGEQNHPPREGDDI